LNVCLFLTVDHIFEYLSYSNGDGGVDNIVVMNIGMLCVKVGRRKWEKERKKMELRQD
jgi:hypothetical protein